MTIREIEDATGLPRANVRYYESLGLIHPARAANGYRDYRQEDLDTLLKIKLLRQLDCSLEDIQALEKGTRSLDQVLSEVGDALEKKASETQHALLGQRELLPGKELSALDQELLETVAGERTWNIDGWDITCQMDFSGYEVYEQYLFPIDGETQNLTYVFSIQASQTQA